MKPQHNLPTTRQERFAYFYAQGCNATESARRAGYGPTTITNGASRVAQGNKMRYLINQYRNLLPLLQSETFIQSMHRLAQCYTANLSLRDYAKASTEVRQIAKLLNKNHLI